MVCLNAPTESIYQFVPVLVGDIIGSASLTARLSSGTTGLQVELLTPVLKDLQTLLGVTCKEINISHKLYYFFA